MHVWMLACPARAEPHACHHVHHGQGSRRHSSSTSPAPATQVAATAPAAAMVAAPATLVAVGGNNGNMVQAANVGMCMACEWRAVTDINPSDLCMRRYSSRITCGFMYLEEVLEV